MRWGLNLLSDGPVHNGYRQPHLDQVYPEGDDLGPYDDYASDSPTHLQGNPPDYVLNRELLVKQGMARTVDADGPMGLRRLSRLNRFDFVIDESRRMRKPSAGEGERDAERRYDLSRDDARRRDYVSNRAFKPLDPNMPHLLVVTFYEARFNGKVDFTVGGTGLEPKVGTEIGFLFIAPPADTPGGCWLFVHPSGNFGHGELAGRVFEGVFTGVIEKVGSFMGDITGWLQGLLGDLVNGPKGMTRYGVGLVCAGIGKLDELTALDGAAVRAGSLPRMRRWAAWSSASWPWRWTRF